MRHPSTTSERIILIGELLAHEGEYGVVTMLSRATGVSRQSLTQWRQVARVALERALSPSVSLSEDPEVERSILTLLVDGHASYRGAQVCLEVLRKQSVSLGTITTVVQAAGDRAARSLRKQIPPEPVALALDEIFGGAARHGYLNAVDARSGVVWAADGPVVPAAAAWQTVLEQLAEQGVRWSTAVHDGGKAAASGVVAVTPSVLRQRDIWHLLHRCAQAQARLERMIRAAEQKWESAERHAALVSAGTKPRYRPPAVPADTQAEAVDTLAQTATDLRMLTGELHRLLAVVVVEHDRILDAATRATEIATVVGLLAELAQTAPATAQPEIRALQQAIVEAQDGLLTFATALDPVQRDLAVVLGEPGVALAGWAWLRRSILGDGEALIAQFPESWRPAVRVLIAAWSGAVRASSAAEGWHSVLRPHLAVHRGLPPALLSLLAFAHNHRVATRGMHAGQSPLQRSGLPDAPTDWINLLHDSELGVTDPISIARKSPQQIAA